jgi:hypothetical protein
VVVADGVDAALCAAVGIAGGLLHAASGLMSRGPITVAVWIRRVRMVCNAPFACVAPGAWPIGFER